MASSRDVRNMAGARRLFVDKWKRPPSKNKSRKCAHCFTWMKCYSDQSYNLQQEDQKDRGKNRETN